MAILEFKSINKEFAGRTILDNACFEVNAGQKLGLIGANGTGKSTILNIITGMLKPDSGSVQLAAEVRVGYVPQHVEIEDDRTVSDYLLEDYCKLNGELRLAEEALAQGKESEHERLLKQYQQIRDRFDHIGGDLYPQRAEGLVSALGLTDKIDQPARLLSGGERNVLCMTRALLADPNLLILDEPGNHLDYHGLAWLDDFICRFRGAIIIVSHNRYLLDRAVGGILELENGKVEYYPGNYSAFKVQKEEKLRAQAAEHKAWQQRVDDLKQLVQKFADIAQGHASDNSWGRRLRSRRSQLDREMGKEVTKPNESTPKISVNFNTEATRCDIALQVNNYKKAFGEQVLFDNANWQIDGGQHWALVGPNGSGKTTILKDIVGYGKWDNQVIRIGPSLSVGYCSQQQEHLNTENTVFDELYDLPNINEQQVFDILARFRFTDEAIQKKIKNLSGGERNRLQLAKLLYSRPNFLILDEPTNHLDIYTCEAIEEALLEFEGTLLVVSHDRYFLDKIVNHVAEVRDRKLVCYDANFTNYWEITAPLRQESTGAGRIASRGKLRSESKDDTPGVGAQYHADRKAKNAELRKAKKTVETLEEEIAKTEELKAKSEKLAADAYMAGDNDKGQKYSLEIITLTDKLEKLFTDWETASEKLSELEDNQ
ncbi:MAG: ABC-F family ATP-binding cassette domain-containing protein [Sedimentisphaerales bacterium]|nr:ABC-F family ATP-binding cassette domain-containing protein [Sedimentisphaerales bacterium]